MKEYFWPIRTGKTFFDVWSIVHFAFWLVFGATAAPMGIKMPWTMVAMLAIAYGWEVFERWAEKTWPKIWKRPESWINSWISDPLMGVLGVLFGYYLVHHQ